MALVILFFIGITGVVCRIESSLCSFTNLRTRFSFSFEIVDEALFPCTRCKLGSQFDIVVEALCLFIK